MHNWSKGWALRSLNIGVSIKEETIFTGANYYPFLTLMIAKSKKKKEKEKYYRCLFFFLGLKYATVICRYIDQILLSPNYQKQRTKNKGATKTSHKKWKDIVSQFQHSTLFTFFIFYFFSPFWWACFWWI